MTHSVSFRRPALALEPFERRHVQAAARLVGADVERAVAAVPVLPPARARPAAHVETLELLSDRGSGMVAVREGELIGFQAAWTFEDDGRRGTYCRDDAHAAAGSARTVVEALYARLAADWLAAGRLEHIVAVSVTDPLTIETFSRLGFGIDTIDLVRDMTAVRTAVRPAITIRPAGVADLETLIALEDGLRAHLAASPVFRPSPPRPRTEQIRRLADPSSPIFFADDDDGRTVAYLRIGPSATDVAAIVRDPATASITGAYTVPDRRGRDVATGLLDHAIGWAREHGYVRCAVDHESANLEASRFWSRHFTPVVLTLVRHVPARGAADGDPGG